jgi:thiamine-phosphate diphosphorylase
MRVVGISDWIAKHREAGTTVLVGSLRQAQQRIGDPRVGAQDAAPAAARALRQAGAGAVCIADVTGAEGRSLVWLDSEHACGWLAAPRAMVCESATVPVFQRHLAAAIARGFVAADAAVLATMACTHRPGSNANANEDTGTEFVHDPALLPQLSWGEEAHFANSAAAVPRRLDLYGIVDTAERLEQVLAAGVRTVQLRIKAPPAPDDSWAAMLRQEVQRSVAACRAAGAELFVNDHWELAAELGAAGVHLGQEDLLALGDAGRSALLARGLALGISSHSLWELCRARALAPRYIACGPVWPTLTKAMPWIPQGLDNLAWWCRMSGFPVVAIGGVLGPEQVYDAARCGADGVCIVRGLGDDPKRVIPQLQSALDGGRKEFALRGTAGVWPHPSLSVPG